MPPFVLGVIGRQAQVYAPFPATLFAIDSGLSSAALKSVWLALVVLANGLFAQSGTAPLLPAIYSVTPASADTLGNSAGRDSGGYFKRPSQGFEHLILWLGTNLSPGSLTMDFAASFTDGSGSDFAITTSSESWGSQARTIKVDFYLGSMLVGTIPSYSPLPDAVLEFELPGDGLVANRVVVTNTTPDSPGIDNLETMTFTNAGARYATAAPSLYGLVDLDDFPADEYGYTKWGNLMDVGSLINGRVYASFTKLTAGPFANTTYAGATPELFLLRSTTDLARVDFPPSTIWNPAGGRLQSGTLNFLPASGLGNGVALMRKLHFPGGLIDEMTGHFLSFDARKVIVLIHGWNPSSDYDAYDALDAFGLPAAADEHEFYDLATSLKGALEGTGWALVLYHWEADADTGPINLFAAVHGTRAAEIAHQHGQRLGALLPAISPRVEQVHFIAHSAGSWAARSAAKALLNVSDAHVQVTLLDPFMPKSAGTDSSLSRERMEEMASFHPSAQLWGLENYYSDDTGTWVAGTQDVFAWGQALRLVANWRVGSSQNLLPPPVPATLVFDYGGHSGPIKFLTDTVRVCRGQAALYPDKIADFDTNLVGWRRSMFQREPIFTALLGDRPVATPSSFVTSGFDVEWSVRAITRAGGVPITYQLVKDGQPLANTTRTSTNGSVSWLLSNVTATDAGQYSVRATTDGVLSNESLATVLRIADSGTPDPPSNLAAAAVSPTQINLVWTAGSTNGTGFKVERRRGSGAWAQITTRSVTNFSDSGLTAGSSYSYRVRAYNSVGDSIYSDVATANTPAAGAGMRTLVVLSKNPSSGAAITLSTDAQGQGDASTPLTRTYSSNKVVTLVASSNVGGSSFQKWQRDGTDFSFVAVAYLTMDADHTMTAVYGPAAGGRTLTGLTIVGPLSVSESTTQPYTAMASFSDGSTLTVAPQQWSLAQNGAPAAISTAGMLDAAAVNADTSVTVQAAYTENGVTKAATKAVTIVNTASSQVYTLGLSVGAHGEVVRTPNQTQFDAGAQVTLRVVAETNYRFAGWGGDAAAFGTTNPIAVTMNGNKSITASFVFDATYFGSVHTVLQPQGVAVAGGQWRLDTGPWKNSGDTFTPDSNGSHNVFFSSVTGYTAPAMQAVQVVSGETKEIVGTYVSLAGPGALQVTLLPQGAVDAGAQWRPQGGSFGWQDSGTTLQGLPGGIYTLEFKTASGWSLPPPPSVNVNDGGTAVVSATYGPPVGVPVIYSIGPNTGPIAGGTDVTIDGANFLEPVNVRFGNADATSVTIVSSSRVVARTPASAAYRTVAVALATAGGTATRVNGFTYVVPRGLHMDLVGQIGGWVQAVAVQGNHLYVGEGCGLVVYDISNPASPTPVGRLALPDLVRDIAIAGGYAYVAADEAGFFVVDIAAPAAPAVAGFYDTPAEADGVAFQNGLAYVADNSGGILILDCADPTAPVVRGSLALGGQSSRVALMTQGGNLYAGVAAMGSGLHTVDVTNPSAPVLMSTFAIDGDAWDVAVSGTRAYVAGLGNIRTVSIVELTNPAAPSLAGHYDWLGALGIAVRGTTAYVGSLSGFCTLNVGNAAAPQLLGSNGTTVARRIALSGDHAYLAEADGGLRVVSIASPSSPTQVARVAGVGEVLDVAGNGSTLFLAGAINGLGVVDGSNPAALRQTGRLDFPGLFVRSVANSNSTAFVATDNGSGAGIAVVRTDQTAPQLVSTYTASLANRLFCDAGLLYVADSNQSLSPFKARFLTLNYSNLSALSVQSQLTNSGAEGRALRAIRVGSRAYFSDQAGVHVVNFNESSSPQRMGDFTVAGLPTGLAVANNGSHLLVANGPLQPSTGLNGGISIADVQDGNQPSVVRTVLTGIPVADVSVVGSLAYAACYGFGIQVIDVGDVLNPVVRASYDTGGLAKAVRVQGDLVFVADQTGGLVALRLLDYFAPVVTITAPSAAAPVATSVGTIDVSGQAIDDQGVAAVAWANNRGGGGTAPGGPTWQASGIQLLPGANVLTFTAADGAGNSGSASLTVNFTPVDTTPPVVSVTYPIAAPDFAASSQTIELRGTATDNQSVAQVSWVNSRGGSGAATGTSAWTAAGIALWEGPNVITITATDVTGNSVTSAVTVTYAPPDVSAPSIVVTFPTINASYPTRDGSLNISGTASDDRGVTKVTWSDDQGGSGTAVGATVWSVNGITLQAGLNIISVTVEDDAGNSSSDALAVTFTPPMAPAIATPPANQTVVAGQNATFSVAASGVPLPTYQWQRSLDGGSIWSNLSDDTTYSGVNTSTLTVNNATPGMAGDAFRVIASNGILPDASSSAATLTVTVPAIAPTIVTQPVSQAVGVDAGVSFTVVAAGTGPFAYRWEKNGGDLTSDSRITGATTATLSIAAVVATDAGTYTVVVSNAADSVTSNNATLAVIDARATHRAAGGYFAGGTVTIGNTITYAGTLSGLGWSVLPPAGWSYASGGGSEGDVKPIVGDASVLEWAWTTIPASPVTFSYTLNVPPGTTGTKDLAALVLPRQSGTQFRVLVQPDPLSIDQVTHHAADTNRDFRISLTELLRVIELYNTHYGTVRTGAYVIDANNLEDGFATDPARSNTAVVTLTTYHSGDSNHDGRLSLTELLRVIELYNTRDGTVRTGEYHVQAGTEDGFAAGP